MIPDPQLADEIISRLNALIQDPAIREDVGRLIETRVSCSEATTNHPTIQTQDGPQFGFLGLLNGILGAIPEGERLAGWGYVAANFDDGGRLTHFSRTKT